MKINVTDFKDSCRACLQQNKIFYNIFTCYYVKRNISCVEMLTNYTKIKPIKQDGLPQLICKDCFRQLKRTYDFCIQCESSEIRLTNLLLNLKSPDNNKTINEVDKVSLCNVKEENNIKLEPSEDKINLISEAVELKLEPIREINDENENWNADDDNLLIEFKQIDPKDETIKKKKGKKKKFPYLDDEELAKPTSKLPHQCDVCGKILSSKSNLNSHKIIHTDQRPFKCKECPASFKGHSGLFQHKRLHTGETPYHCEYCPKQFRKKTTLIYHIRTHTGEKEYDCKICLKSFVQSAQLAIHMKRHSGDKTYLCQDCGKAFIIKADLKVHQRIHNGEKPYSCHLCEKTFATSGNLSIHVRIHNREFRYTCKYCSRGFITCSSYNVHLKRHRGQRDYSCECGKKFYTSSALKQHKVVHTGEKRYQCKICDRKFTQTSHLSRHFRKDHAKPDDPLPNSDQYKIVLPAENETSVFNLKMDDGDLKCEA
ncbi:zinc finger protein OZF-like [Pieris napi]|uniref:zinc finger protein OZF-like n=1 Tax=Pieris napi TaxID=78633 RepID=UPI001FB929B6|nr:zinc finger protein OZF-like [Pieris napi]XP_047510889.1 zinc finger protein OZF-like [Pieris napi]